MNEIVPIFFTRHNISSSVSKERLLIVLKNFFFEIKYYVSLLHFRAIEVSITKTLQPTATYKNISTVEKGRHQFEQIYPDFSEEKLLIKSFNCQEMWGLLISTIFILFLGLSIIGITCKLYPFTQSCDFSYKNKAENNVLPYLSISTKRMTNEDDILATVSSKNMNECLTKGEYMKSEFYIFSNEKENISEQFYSIRSNIVGISSLSGESRCKSVFVFPKTIYINNNKTPQVTKPIQSIYRELA